MHVFQESEAVVLIGKDCAHIHSLTEKDVNFVTQSYVLEFWDKSRFIHNKTLSYKNPGITCSSYSIVLTAGIFC